MKLSYGPILVFLASLLAGCEQLGIENPAVAQAREEAEGKAIGSGCRQTARPLEDCYQNNRRFPKAAIFAGWREMDAYMRENKIEDIKTELPAKPPAAKGRPLDSAAEGGDEAAKPAAETKPAEVKPAEAAPAKKTKPASAH